MKTRRAALLFLLTTGLPGCAGRGPVDPAGPARKLARVGLEIETDDEALIPPGERGRFIPLRVIRGFPEPSLQEDPAGYLIVRLAGPAPSFRRRPDGEPEGDSGGNAAGILRALEDWSRGETLKLTVRRNPYRAARLDGSGWWEADVAIRQP